MKYRPLGVTDILVSEIGFGGWGIGGVRDGALSYGPVDDAESLAALRRAFERGVTFFDTAGLYGYGHSEQIIGRAFRRDRARVVIASKGGLLNAAGDQDFSAAHLRQSVEASLRRLQTDYIDVYQLHNPPVDAMSADDPAIVELQQMQREGKIRAVGLSGRSPEDALTAAGRLCVAAVQANFSMIDQRATGIGLFERCQTEGIGVICRTPLCYGFLTHKYARSAERAFAPGDHRLNWSDGQIARWAEAPAVFEDVRQRAAQSAGQLALRFCLSYTGVATVIPGMLTIDQVEENVAASDMGPLPESDLREIERLYATRDFFVRPATLAHSAS